MHLLQVLVEEVEGSLLDTFWHLVTHREEMSLKLISHTLAFPDTMHGIVALPNGMWLEKFVSLSIYEHHRIRASE